MSKGDRVRKYNKKSFDDNYDSIFDKKMLTPKIELTEEEQNTEQYKMFQEIKKQKEEELARMIYEAVVDNFVRMDNELKSSFFTNGESGEIKHTSRGYSLYSEIEFEIKQSEMVGV